MMLLFWILLGIGIFYFIKNNDTTVVKNRKERTPEDILKERFVNGEIDEATFEKMKTTINR